jgi:hypothetical protein
MRTTSLLAVSLALVVGSSSFACSGGDGEDLGESSDELTSVGDDADWEGDEERASAEVAYRGKVDSLSVQGNQIRANGHRFVSRGVIFEGFLYTERDIKKCVAQDYNGDNEDRKFCQRHLLARDYYEGKGQFAGKDALTLAMTNWNANTVRFNLNQSALDPSSKDAFDPDYIDEIAKVTRMARDRGLVVILAPFSGRNEGAPDKLVTSFPKYPMPTSDTMGAVDVLARRFGDDPGVVIDLFNEPFGNWKTYLDGGMGSGEWQGVKFVGVNDLLDRMRSRNAKNVAIVQGLSADWSDYPGGIRDGKVAFSGHPFLPNKAETLTGQHIDWYSMFGEIARTKPYWITAWDASAKDKWCKHFGIELATEFVQYTDKKDMGMVGFAFDSPYSMTRDFRDRFDEPSVMGTACSDSAGAHAGDILQKSFKGTLPALKNGKPNGGKISISKNQKVGKPITLNVDASDPDHDPLSYAARVEGDPMSPRQHASSFHLTFDKVGKKKVTISIADNKGGAIRKTVTIHVTR